MYIYLTPKGGWTCIINQLMCVQPPLLLTPAQDKTLKSWQWLATYPPDSFSEGSVIKSSLLQFQRVSLPEWFNSMRRCVHILKKTEALGQSTSRSPKTKTKA